MEAGFAYGTIFKILISTEQVNNLFVWSRLDLAFTTAVFSTSSSCLPAHDLPSHFRENIGRAQWLMLERPFEVEVREISKAHVTRS